MESHNFYDTFRDLDRHSRSWISVRFFWTHKNLILFPLDVILDCLTAKSHFDNDNTWWGYLTILWICLPNVLCFFNLVYKSLDKTSSGQTKNEETSNYQITDYWIIDAMLHLFFLHFITYYR